MTSQRPLNPKLHLHGELPFCDLRTVNLAYADAEARGDKAGVEDLLQTFNFADQGAFGKIHGRKVTEESAEAVSGNKSEESKERT